MANAANHLHRYKKVNLGSNGKTYFVYRCTKPACSHYIRVSLAEGSLCECNRCGEAMIITKKVLTHSSNRPATKPVCPNCVVHKNKKNVDAIADFLAQANK